MHFSNPRTTDYPPNSRRFDLEIPRSQRTKKVSADVMMINAPADESKTQTCEPDANEALLATTNFDNYATATFCFVVASVRSAVR